MIFSVVSDLKVEFNFTIKVEASFRAIYKK